MAFLSVLKKNLYKLMEKWNLMEIHLLFMNPVYIVIVPTSNSTEYVSSL